MTQREKTKQAMDELILTAKKDSQYTKDSVMNIMCICGSKQMHAQGVTTENALKKATELIKSGLEKSKVYSELLKLAGYEEE
ncbi:MAG: hypothetical protein E7362_00735 [Clostridiales bacterium]|nr:hypothetical protein [Clostridiales bacterium]